MAIGNFISSQALPASQNNIVTKRMISMEDGLPTRMIFDALQDKDGFMWFATANGLCRYDGYSFKIFNTQNAPLPSNTITKLGLDSKNHLFIQSTINYYTDDHLNDYQVLDLNTYQFIKLDEALPKMPFKANQIKHMSYDALGSLYFLTDKPCKLWQYHTTSFFTLRADFSNTVDSNAVLNPRAIIINSANDCIIISFEQEYHVYAICPKKAPILIRSNRNLTAIMENKQIFFYDDSSKSYQAIDSLGKQSALSDHSFISKTNWNNIKFSGQSHLFISKEYNIYLSKENECVEISNRNEQKNFGYFGILAYYEDRNGSYWFCTDKGIYQVIIRKNQFEHLFSDFRFNKNASSTTRSIYVDYNETGEKRIFAMVDFFLRIKDKQEQTIQQVSGVTILKKNDWFYSASQKVLYKYNLTTRKNRTCSILNIGDIWSMADFFDSIILIGGSSGIIAHNTRSDVSVPICYAQKNLPPPINVYRIIKTKAKGWIAVAENGIYFINDQCIVYDYYGKAQQQQDKRLPFTGIFDFFEDKEGFAWLALNGEGLIRWNWNASHPMAAENFKKFNIENGLPDNILYRIEEDNANNLWISCYSALVKFNKHDFATKIFRKQDGLVNNEFNRISSFKDSKGWMYFGGQNGIDAFDPNLMISPKREDGIPFRMITLSKYSSGREKVIDMTDDFLSHKEMVMLPDEHSLDVTFSLLDYQDRRHLYAFRIDGLDKNWKYFRENSLRINGLPYGKNAIHIKAQLESGNWSQQEMVIHVLVVKPFYFQNWFLILLLMLAIGSVYGIMLWRAGKYKKNTILLEQKVQQRTKRLNNALSEKELLLTEIHHRVKNNLQVISGLLELRKSGIEDEKGIAAFNESQSGIMSIAMIHELLYQNENIGNLEFNIILNNIISNVSQLFGRQDKKINFVIVPNNYVFNIDTAVTLGLILNELLTNAFKYLPSGKHNKVVIEITETGNRVFCLRFHDNGPGLPSGFDFKASTGIGFSMIKSLAMQLQGTIAYEFAQGSKFVLTFKERVKLTPV